MLMRGNKIWWQFHSGCNNINSKSEIHRDDLSVSIIKIKKRIQRFSQDVACVTSRPFTCLVKMISWLTPEETVTALGYFLYRCKCQPQICALVVSVWPSFTSSVSLISDAETGLEIHQVSRPPGLNTERRRSRAVLYQLSGHLQKQDKTKSKLKINNVRQTYW